MSTLWQDLRSGFRSIRHAPAFATLVVLTFALGIGAATVIWSVEVSLEAANRELEVIAGRTAQENGGALPQYEGWRLEAMSWTDINVRQVRPAALILLGAAVRCGG